jgi:hypothetical protein
MLSPTARTLDALRKSGWIACVVERFIQQRNIRVDAFGLADVLAAHPRNRTILLVQATSLSNVSARVKKIQGRPEAQAWLAAGGAIEVWGWTRQAGKWKAKVVAITAEDMQAEVIVSLPRRRRRDRCE